MATVGPTALRARFATTLSELYGREVPAYRTLVEVAHQVNADVAARAGADAERLGSLDRVTAERHGAIRVGTPAELAQVARVFAAMGMHPTGYYDLRDAAASSVPVVSTAFRPLDADELAANPFRVFTSVLAATDRRFFSADLSARLQTFLARRRLFPGGLLALADRAVADGGLADPDAATFLRLAAASFALSSEPIDRAWYRELEQVSAVAADIGGVTSTHVNHLTPRVLDIDALYAAMSARGIAMIDAIQGPPRWAGPDVLLRQTSFRALAEPRRFVDADGSVVEGSLRVRFGEVEARGIALTRAGRARYDAAMSAIEGLDGASDAAAVWAQHFPATEAELWADELGIYTVTAVTDRAGGAEPHGSTADLLRDGWLRADPVVYEDFLPRSAAGIFQSNLSDAGSKDTEETGAALDADWLEGVLDRPLHDPFDIYAAQHRESLVVARRQLGLPTLC
ncbi:2-oxoadipate dioxygenase/decarboxylase family protein [uncultured Friedmanniella sp.]|uniref:2-oxoadipate dioxygenase/decarboxylase n=1 Tax=uncultured Friedmanniella sp. TaxID=335381 RepID=UPI0035CA235A